MKIPKNVEIHNVVCTANLNQKVDITKLSHIPGGMYDQEIYSGRCGYIKTPSMKGRVTIFPSGKMISVGGKSIKNATEQIYQAKFLLLQKNLISDVLIETQVRNIVSTINIHKKIGIEKLSSKIPGSIYDPETFPGLILKGLWSCTFLIFGSGKIVIVGTKSIKELNKSIYELIQKLESLNY